MTIASLAEATRGRLLNDPSISQIEGFSFSPKTTRRGDCYFHNGDENAINAAIANGAFAIVFAHNVQLGDSEIAWIAVDDMNRALLSIARYLLIERNIAVFRASKISAAIAKSVIADKRLIVNPACQEAIEELNRDKEFSPLFVCQENVELLEAAIAIEPFALENAPPQIEVVEETILKTTILYENQLISLALPSLFLTELSATIGFAQRFGLQTRFDRALELERFKIDSIAQGERLLIYDRANEKEANEAIAFIRRVAPWAKLYIPNDRLDFPQNFTVAYLNGFSPDDLKKAAPQIPSLFGE
ncbi:MAG: hypothetical protein LBQ52_02010 [Helicobacteraceae bacterium]|jgi:ferrochelatase|nr:hypothetical protein [Helicobacteraceae bacterium]